MDDGNITLYVFFIMTSIFETIPQNDMKLDPLDRLSISLLPWSPSLCDSDKN